MEYRNLMDGRTDGSAVWLYALMLDWLFNKSRKLWARLSDFTVRDAVSIVRWL